jgi:predicted DNA-binding WGR domain protein
MWTWLEKVDYEQKTNRWYAIGVQSTLLDDIAVIRFWGSRGNRYQRMLIEPFTETTHARARADDLIRTRLQRGYCIRSGYVPTNTKESK